MTGTDATEDDGNGDCRTSTAEEEKATASADRSSCSSSFIPAPLCLAGNPAFSLPLGITELAGTAGAGKTQLVLSLCADVVVATTTMRTTTTSSAGNDYCGSNNNNNKAVYVSLGGSSGFLRTAAGRLHGMLRSRAMTTAEGACPNDGNEGGGNDSPRQREHQQKQSMAAIHHSMGRILLRWVRNSDELMDLLRDGLPRLLSLHRPTITLVVLDGIADLFRVDEDGPGGNGEQGGEGQRGADVGGGGGTNRWHRRSVTFFQVSALCKALSSTYQVPFVVVNGATSRGGTAQQGDGAAWMTTTMTDAEPALGLAWSQCVNCRFWVTRGRRRLPQHQRWGGGEEGPPATGRPTSGDEDEDNDRPPALRPDHQPRRQASRMLLVPPAANNIVPRQLHCLKAPHISSSRPGWGFWVDTRGVHPIPDLGSTLQRR